MNISQDIRDLIKRVAQELAAADGALVGVIHAHAASNSIVAMVRQELDYVVHHGFDNDGVAADEPVAVEEPAAVVVEPTQAVKPKKAEPAPVVEPEEEKADEDGDAEA